MKKLLSKKMLIVTLAGMTLFCTSCATLLGGKFLAAKELNLHTDNLQEQSEVVRWLQTFYFFGQEQL